MNDHISVKECKKGTSYRVIVRVQEQGQMRSVTKTFPSWKYASKKDALRAARIYRDRMLAKLSNHHLLEDRKKTLADVVELKRQTFIHAPETERSHDIILRKYVYPIIPPSRPFVSISYLDLNKVFASAKSVCSQDHLNRIKYVLNQLFKAAQIANIVEVNQMDKVIIPNSTKPVKQRKRSTSSEEIKEVFEYLDKIHDKELAQKIKLAIEVMRYTGIRTSECMALAKEDFDLDNKLLFITKGIRLDENRVPYVSTYKTSSSQRVIPIDDKLVDLIKNEPQGLLFELRGKIISSIDIANALKGVKGFNLYQLRHQFATDLVKIADLGTVQSLMGHSSPTTTISYVETNLQSMRDALNRRKK